MTLSAFTLSEISQANVLYHSSMAQTYNADSPHYKSENRQKVANCLQQLSQNTSGKRLVDLGCGTGFILDLATAYFESCVGVDITDAMMAQFVPHPQVTLLKADITQALPLPEGEADVCTCYGVLHHLEALAPTLTEAFRLLKPGGYFYSDSDPNRSFFQQFYAPQMDLSACDEIIQREIVSTAGEDIKTSEQYGIDIETVQLAEFQKIKKGGLDPQEVTQLFKQIGFVNVTVKYEWFLGQGNIMHHQSFEQAEYIESYLLRCLPLSQNLFKYLKFTAQKPG